MTYIYPIPSALNNWPCMGPISLFLHCSLYSYWVSGRRPLSLFHPDLLFTPKMVAAVGSSHTRRQPWTPPWEPRISICLCLCFQVSCDYVSPIQSTCPLQVRKDVCLTLKIFGQFRVCQGAIYHSVTSNINVSMIWSMVCTVCLTDHRWDTHPSHPHSSVLHSFVLMFVKSPFVVGNIF
jgi:hypothetical protein